jgi:hypothetical protein
MQVIARIPDGSEPAAPAVAAADAARRPVVAARPAPRPRGAVPRRTRPWPSWPVAALAVIAVLAWIMATWNDHDRLRRQRGGTRLALEPAAASAGAEPAAAPRGAVVR